MHRKIQEKDLDGMEIDKKEIFVRVLRIEGDRNRARVRPRKTWMECLKEDLAEKN
jgi:hypothetical protein